MKIYTDGGSRGNPGKAASSFVIYDNEDEIYSQSKYLGIKSNNYAEYYAVLMALQYIANSTQHTEVFFYSDSELIVRQLNGIYKIKNIELQKLAIEIKQLISEKKLNIEFNHIKRSGNKRADELVNIELDKHL